MFLPLFFPDGRVHLKATWPLFHIHAVRWQDLVYLLQADSPVNSSEQLCKAQRSRHFINHLSSWFTFRRGYSSAFTSNTNGLLVWTGLVERQQPCGRHCSLLTPTLIKWRLCFAFGMFSTSGVKGNSDFRCARGEFYVRSINLWFSSQLVTPSPRLKCRLCNFMVNIQ